MNTFDLPGERQQLTARKLAAVGDPMTLATINQALAALTEQEKAETAASVAAAANGERWARLHAARAEVENAKNAPRGGITNNYALRVNVAERNLREIEGESRDLLEQERQATEQQAARKAPVVAVPQENESWV